jgi:aspartyl-tRNA(Asn)/glutamyl-tRNA(Gln) amidotransferase subunit C
MIDRETVRNVANLAKIGLSDADIEKFQVQLSAILQQIEILQEADVSGVSPTAHASRLHSIVRPDQPRPSYPPEVILANAPDQEDHYLKVNAVLEGE